MGDRLDEHAGHCRVVDAEADDRSELVLVDATLDRGGQRDADAGLGAVVERPDLLGGQRAAANRELGLLLEAVELQVDVDPELGQCGREAAVTSEADPVRVEHHQRDAAALGGGQHLNDPGVDRRLPAGELNRLRRTLRTDERVEH